MGAARFVDCPSCKRRKVLHNGRPGRPRNCDFCRVSGTWLPTVPAPEPLAKYESNEAKLAAREFFLNEASRHFAHTHSNNVGMITLTDLREKSDEPQQAVDHGLVGSLSDIIGFSDVFGVYRDGITVKREKIEESLAEVMGYMIGQGKDGIYINLDYCRTIHINRKSLEECLRIASCFARGVSLYIGVNVCYNHRAGKRATTGKVVAERGAPLVSYEWSNGHERVWIPDPLYVATPEIYTYRSSKTSMQMFGIAN
jgi:hypothetical protein